MSNRPTRKITAALGWLALLIVLPAHAGRVEKGATPPLFSTPHEQCIVPAAQYHSVNHHILRAILRVESNLNPTAVAKNKNGTFDIGIGQINSMHLKELGRFGVNTEHLRDACIGTYVSAWHLAKMLRQHGNTWFGVAAYHSATPYFNRRYQALLNNELVRSGVITGTLLEVPPLNPTRLQ